MNRATVVVSSVLVLALLFGLVALLSAPVSGTPVSAVSAHVAGPASNSSSDPSSTVSCPAGSTLSWGQISLNCFQTLDLTEIAALVIGIVIAVYIYWNADRAELPGDAADPPVTAEEEAAARAQRTQEEA